MSAATELVALTSFVMMVLAVLVGLLVVVVVNWLGRGQSARTGAQPSLRDAGRRPMPTATAPLAATRNGHGNGHSSWSELATVAAARTRYGATATAPALRALIIVSRDRPELYEHLKAVFGGRGQADLVVDRRTCERRSLRLGTTHERRRAERRRRGIDADLRTTGWALLLLLT